MRESEKLYKMAAYIRRNGFSFGVGVHGGPRCFAGADLSVDPAPHSHDPMALIDLLGASSFTANKLRDDGWTKRDAIAACEMAGDIATVAERP